MNLELLYLISGSGTVLEASGMFSGEMRDSCGLSWLSISMAYSRAFSCGGTEKPLERRKAWREEIEPWWTTVPLERRRNLSMVERILNPG